MAQEIKRTPWDDLKADLNACGFPTVSYSAAIAQIAGGVNAGLLLCQMFYWQFERKHRGMWFFKTEVEIEKATGLTRSMQETARKKLRENNLLTEKRYGMPLRLCYSVNRNILAARLKEAGFLQEGVS